MSKNIIVFKFVPCLWVPIIHRFRNTEQMMFFDIQRDEVGKE